MIIYTIAGRFFGLLHNPTGPGGYYASGTTRDEVIAKLLANITNNA